MRTRYRIDTYQKTYFVIDSFEQLMDATEPGLHADLRASCAARIRFRPATCCKVTRYTTAAPARAGRRTATCRLGLWPSVFWR